MFDVGRTDTKLFCYYSSYAQNRPDAGKFLPEDIDPDLCTHVIFAFADIIQGSKLKASGWNDLENGKDAGIITQLQTDHALSWHILPFYLLGLDRVSETIHRGKGHYLVDLLKNSFILTLRLVVHMYECIGRSIFPFTTHWDL